MVDKEKRFRKILSKFALKGKLKLVATLEEAHLVLINEKGHAKFHIAGKDSYLRWIEKGHIFPEEEVYYLVSANPRNRQLVEQKYLTNAFADIKRKPK